MRSHRFLVALVLALLWAETTQAQEGTSIAPDVRGSQQWLARGILDGNLVETNFRNFAEFARWNDAPWGFWPRGNRNRHIDGIGMSVSSRVRGHRQKYPAFFGSAPDTVLNPISMHYESGFTLGPAGEIWGWLPLPNFHNYHRLNLITREREPTPALSDDPESWPRYWPDRLHEDDPGWPGSWNGIFGKIITADLETFYVIDDLGAMDYALDPHSKRPYSELGVFYPDPSDSTKGGLGLQVEVRALQWANVLAEDSIFIIYRITNVGAQDFGAQLGLPCVEWREGVASRRDECASGLHLTQWADFGLGWEEFDEGAAYDPQLDIAWGWDYDGIGVRDNGSEYQLGVTGFAFLESPVRRLDGVDNDEDGVVDEDRFSGVGQLIEGAGAIRAYVESNYDLANFARANGEVTRTRAFLAGRWWTGDEDLDWVGFSDRDGDRTWEAGEFLNDDFGRDGLGPYDPGYPGPDTGEGDGIPDIPEPNFDETDIDEGDQIGLTGVHLADGPYYWASNMMSDDSWMWARIQEHQFLPGAPPVRAEQADIQPFITWDSGPVSLAPAQTDFFSSAWIFGWDEDDFLRNRRVVQTIYNADYRFAQPPILPPLSAEAGDGFVVLSWDSLSLASWDRFSQTFDFEGFRLYRGTDPLLSDARVISDFAGAPTYYRPLIQWDLKNGITGNRSVLDGDAIFDLGNDTGLGFSYVDHDVRNGVRYYYALVAYDHGFQPPVDPLETNPIAVDPQENTFNITVDAGGTVRSYTPNVQIVSPRSQAAGYESARVEGDLSKPAGTTILGAQARGTGSIAVRFVDESLVPDGSTFRITFYDTTTAPSGLYETVAYDVRNADTGEMLLRRSTLQNSTPAAAGFSIEINNDRPGLDMGRTGWVGANGSEQDLISPIPGDIPGYDTNWRVVVTEDLSEFFRATTDEFELRYSADSPQSAAQTAGGAQAIQAPFACENLTRKTPCHLLARDRNADGSFDAGDVLIVSESEGAFGPQFFRYQVAFGLPAEEEGSAAPHDGARIRISNRRPFATGDYFEFTLRAAATNTARAREELAEVAVVPNPYLMAAEWEPATAITGRGPRQLQFINLPEACTIRIFTIRGELVRTIEHNGIGGSGSAWWDLRTQDDQDVSYGVYLYHVDAPGIGETSGKFAVVK